ncbi:unnamed protein product [Urochloa humidicola]
MELVSSDLAALGAAELVRVSAAIPRAAPRTFALLTACLVFLLSFAVLAHSLFTHPVLLRGSLARRPRQSWSSRDGGALADPVAGLYPATGAGLGAEAAAGLELGRAVAMAGCSSSSSGAAMSPASSAPSLFPFLRARGRTTEVGLAPPALACGSPSAVVPYNLK